MKLQFTEIFGGIYDIEEVLMDTQTISFNKLIFKLEKWTGISLKNTFGNKPQINYKNNSLFAEVAILKILQDNNFNAVWIETYAMKNKKPYYFNDWIDGKLTEQKSIILQDEKIVSILDSISIINETYAGCWDILCWKNEKIYFIDCKRKKKDFLRKTQIKWYQSALEFGLINDNFIIFEWDFI